MAEIKQYMNLEPDSSEESHGRTRTIKLSMDKKEITKVFLFLKPDGGNKAAKDLKLEHRAGINAINTEVFSKPTAADGTLEFDLLMSNHGGDKFTVEAAMDAKGKDGAKSIPDTYVTWKKLYYQVSTMKSSFEFSFDKTIKEYENYFIELEKTSKITVPHKENLETTELPSYAKHFKKEKSPFEAHIVLIENNCDPKVRKYEVVVRKKKTVFKYPESDWPFGDWLIKAESSVGAGAMGSGKISVSQKGKSILVDVSGCGVNPKKETIAIEVHIKTLESRWAGDAGTPPHLFIVTKDQSLDEKNNTVVHEFGHAVGMVPTSGHDKQYSHNGSHCSTGAKFSKTEKAKGESGYSKGSCTMFEVARGKIPFCATCKKFMFDVELYKTSMKSRGWG